VKKECHGQTVDHHRKNDRIRKQAYTHPPSQTGLRHLHPDPARDTGLIMEQARTAKPPAHDQLLTLTEAADILRTPVATLRYWRHLGIGPDGFRVGRRVMYRIEDLDRWITEQHDAEPRHRSS